jgi:hypothetical protein
MSRHFIIRSLLKFQAYHSTEPSVSVKPTTVSLKSISRYYNSGTRRCHYTNDLSFDIFLASNRFCQPHQNKTISCQVANLYTAIPRMVRSEKKEHNRYRAVYFEMKTSIERTQHKSRGHRQKGERVKRSKFFGLNLTHCRQARTLECGENYHRARASHSPPI